MKWKITPNNRNRKSTSNSCDKAGITLTSYQVKTQQKYKTNTSDEHRHKTPQ